MPGLHPDHLDGLTHPDDTDPPTGWLVVTESHGSTVGEFDDREDAENMAAAWNHASPHEPWFVVAEKPAA